MVNVINGGNPYGYNTFSTTSLNSTAAPITSNSLRFPGDLGEGNFNHWMSFTFYEYQRPTVSYVENGFKSVRLEDKGTIRLPLPNGMVDHQDQDYNIEALATTLASFAGLNAQSINTIVGAGGMAVNPLMGVFYKSPTFKTHRFSWRLTPANHQESYALNAIINNFRANQLPASRGPILLYPNMVQVTISNNNPEKFTYSFKPALIRAFEVNFTPEGIPSFFHDPLQQKKTAPTAVEIRMELLEMEFWVQQDYGIGKFEGIPGVSLNEGAEFGTGLWFGSGGA
jgi:hypothetical protein